MKYVAFVLLLSSFFDTQAHSPQDLIRKANEAYGRSEYQYAIELYEQVIGEGLVAADLYYNLGNAYFKTNRTGKAILNYERALRYRPMDEDIQHNLQVARTRIVDRIDQRPLLFYERWWQNTYMMQSASGWAVTAIVLLCAFLFSVAVYLFSRTRVLKKTSFFLGIVLFLCMIFSFVFAQKQYNRLTGLQDAIVMQVRVTAKSSPSTQSPDLFLIHEGTRVHIRSDLGQWYEIRLPNGSVGWVKKDALEII